VGNWCDIPNECNFQSCSLESADSSFATGTRSTNHYLKLTHTLINCPSGGTFSGGLGSKGCSLFCSLKSTRTSTCPRNNISVLIGDGDNAIVESRLDVGHPARYIPLLLFAPGFFSWLSCHICLVSLRYNLLLLTGNRE